MPVHPAGCDCGSYACELRNKGVSIAHAATPNKVRKGKPGSNAEYNGWEKGLAGEKRPGGTFMPHLDGKGNTIGVKQFSEKRHQYETRLKKLRSGGAES